MRNYHKRLFEESEIRIKETENKRKEAENQAAILNSPRQTRRHLPSYRILSSLLLKAYSVPDGPDLCYKGPLTDPEIAFIRPIFANGLAFHLHQEVYSTVFSLFHIP